MMRYFFAVLTVFLFCCSLEAQIPRHVVTYTPQHVHAGDTVHVTYNFKHLTSAFQINSGMYMLVYTFSEYPLDQNDYMHPVVKQVTMMRRDSTWTASFVMDVPDVKFFMMKFQSTLEEDNNNGYFWTGLIYGKNDVPVENAYAFRAYNERGLAADSMYHMRPVIDTAFSDIDKEIQLYPKNFMAWDMKFRMLKDKYFGLSTEMFGTIDSVIKATDPPIDEYTVSRIAHWYVATGKRDKALALEDQWIKQHPHSNFAFITEFQRANSIRDPLDRTGAIRTLLRETASDSGYAFHAGRLWMINYYTESGKFASAESLMTYLRHPTIYDYNTIVNGYLSYVNTSDTGKNSTELSHALDLEQTALDSESSHPFYMNDPSLTDQDKQLYENGLLAQFHGTIARLDLLLGQPDSALRHFILAIQLGHAQDPDVVSAALHLTIAQAKSDPQIGQVMPILAMGASNDSLQQLVDEAYKQFDNPPVSLDQMHDMVRMMKQNMRQMAFCRHQYRAVAPGFVLPTLDKRITDSLPKGKIVVLDFWGTWCAPCVKTLPKLDSVYQAFKMNDDIRFYAIDCMEDTSSFEVLKPRVKEFLKNNNITIPVLFDTANAVVKSYGIIYYPTRIIIDKQGVIRVFEVGYPWENVTDNVTFQLNELIDDACNTHPH